MFKINLIVIFLLISPCFFQSSEAKVVKSLKIGTEHSKQSHKCEQFEKCDLRNRRATDEMFSNDIQTLESIKNRPFRRLKNRARKIRNANSEAIKRLVQTVNLELWMGEILPNQVTTYTGNVSIEFSVDQTVEELRFPAGSYNISSVELINATETVSGSLVETENDFTFSFGKNLIQNQSYTLKINFTSRLRGIKGFIKQGYVNNGTEKLYAVTGNRWFPCFEDMLAMISVKIHHPRNYTAVASSDKDMLTADDEQLSAWTATSPISVSSFAIAIATLTSITLDDTAATNLTLYYRREALSTIVENRINFDQFSPSMEMLSGIVKYLNVPYAGGKIDIVCLPALSSNVVTDGWGVIFIQEEIFDVPSVESAYTFLLTLTKKLSEQFFGGMVTSDPKWLNDGISEFMKYKIMENEYPEDQSMDQMVVDSLQLALANDGDAINGVKVANILRMFHDTYGDQTMRNALQAYIRNRKFQLGTLSDFLKPLKYEILTRNPCTCVNHSKIISNWLQNPGYPVIHISLDDCTLNITQERFSYNGTAHDNQTWIISLWKSKTSRFFIKKKTVLMPTPKAWDEVWQVAEMAQNGTFRVNYDETLWTSLIQKLNSTNFTDIPVIARTRLIDDAFNLARANIISYDIAWQVVGYLHQESDYLPWATAHKHFKDMLTLFRGTDVLQDIREYIAPRVASLYEALGNPRSHDTLLVKKLRNIAVDLLCRVKHEMCKTNITQQLMGNADWMTSLDVDLREAACCSAASASYTTGIRLYERLTCLNKLPSRNDPDAFERRLLLRCLSCSKNSTHLHLLVLYEKFKNFTTKVHATKLRKNMLENAGYSGVIVAMRELRYWLPPYQDIEDEPMRMQQYDEMREYIKEIGRWVINTDQVKLYGKLIDVAIELKYFDTSEKTALMVVPIQIDKWTASNEDRVWDFFFTYF